MKPPLHFLYLPVEIRLEVYEFVLGLSSSTEVEVSINLDPLASSDAGRPILQHKKRPSFHPGLAVFRVCSQVYREALPILYQRCSFYPLADVHVIRLFFGQMSDFPRSNVSRLHLKPRSHKTIRFVGPQHTLSQLVQGPSWSLVCDQVYLLFPTLKELCIHLHTMYGHQLERGDSMSWLVRPLCRLNGVDKTLYSIGNETGNEKTALLAKIWNELIKRISLETAEYAACRNRIMQNQRVWPDSYWFMKRNHLL